MNTLHSAAKTSSRMTIPYTTLHGTNNSPEAFIKNVEKVLDGLAFRSEKNGIRTATYSRTWWPYKTLVFHSSRLKFRTPFYDERLEL